MTQTPTSFILFSGKKDAEKDDKRYRYLSELLIEDGKRVFVFNKNDPCIMGEEINCENLKEREESLIAILSFFLTPEEKQEILSSLPRSSVIFGGKLSPEEKKLCKDKGHIFNDLLNDDVFCKDNAIPTAEAALAIAINETPFALRDKSVLILGFGRVAKETARIFRAVGMKTVCAVRRSELFDEIKEKGCGTALITDEGISAEKFSLGDFKVIINTVPPPGRITEKHASFFCPDALFIDLAPCDTVDMLKACGIKAVNAPSLPGKTAPQSGAEYIYNAVKSRLNDDERS